MKLKKLLSNIPIKQIKGSKDLEITGVCANSKLIAPGNLFIARKGKIDDGARYIPEAIAAGAVAVLTDIYDPLLKNEITQILHPDVNFIEGLLAARYYQYASEHLFIVGITGTNGKTTTSFITKHLLDHLDGLTGIIGTIEYIIGTQRYQASRTTPDVSSTHKMLREMVIHQCKHAVLEVTSHALDQKRVAEIDFDTVVFTNLSLDHLDYHFTMEHYFNTKCKLFSSLKVQKIKECHPGGKTAIINNDSDYAPKILAQCQAKVITYGIDSAADLRAENIYLSPLGTSLTINFAGKKMDAVIPLAGRFNVYNCLAAIAIALTRGHSLETIIPLLKDTPKIPGRLEIVPNDLEIKIYVDFAHTDDALLNILESLNEFKVGRLICVFGCGGNRDTSKRPKMAQVCETHADVVIVTSDNPRTEDPAIIVEDILKGFSATFKPIIELDRYRAIEIAIDMATSDDIILIAGKGHEPYQLLAHKTIEFDDRQVASQICQKKVNQTEMTHN